MKAIFANAMQNIAITFVMMLIISGGSHAKDISKTGFKDCSSGVQSEGTISNLNVEPCNEEPCRLKRGTSVSLAVTFKPKFASHTLSANVFGVVAGVPAPFPLPNPDGCRSVGCPTEAGDTFTYKEALAVERFYPKMNLTVKWQLMGDSKKEVWCFTMPASIVD